MPLPGANASLVVSALTERGASFFADLVQATGLLRTQVEQALAELAALGLVTSDGFAGLRALITPESKRPPMAATRRRGRTVPFGVESAGRWSVLNGVAQGRRGAELQEDLRADAVEHLAMSLLRRYGVVFRKLLVREPFAVPWRELLRVFWRLEARGDVRGGRFVAGITGEQFALPEAVTALRAVRKREKTGELVAISGADPLNMTGVLTPEERVAALASNRIVFEDGKVVAIREAGETRILGQVTPEKKLDIERAIVRKRVSPALRARLGMAI